MSMQTPADAPVGTHERVLHRMAEELSATFDGVFGPEMVERYMFESYTALARSAKVRTTSSRPPTWSSP